MVSDAQLLLEFTATRGQQTFARLCAVHLDFLQCECRQLLRERFTGDVDDAVQMVLVTFWQKAGMVDPYKQRAWLGKTAQNVCFRILRDGGVDRRHLAVLRADLENQHRAVTNHPPALCDAEIAVRTALAQLTKRQRQAVTLHHMQGKSVEEVAIDTRLSEGGVKYHLGLGLKRLRQILKDLGIVGAVLLPGLRRLVLPLRRVAFGLSPKATAAGAIALTIAAGTTAIVTHAPSPRPQLIAAAVAPAPPRRLEIVAPPKPEPEPEAASPALRRRVFTEVRGATLRGVFDIENLKSKFTGDLPIETNWDSLHQVGVDPNMRVFMTIDAGTLPEQVQQVLSHVAPPGTLRAVVEKDRIRIENNPDPRRTGVR